MTEHLIFYFISYTFKAPSKQTIQINTPVVSLGKEGYNSSRGQWYEVKEWGASTGLPPNPDVL